MKNLYILVKHPCPFCPYRASDKQHLKKHIKSVHEDGKLRKSQNGRVKQICNICKTEYDRKSLLRKHTKSKHKDKNKIYKQQM